MDDLNKIQLLPENAFDDDVDDGEEGVDALFNELTNATQDSELNMAVAASNDTIKLQLPNYHKGFHQQDKSYCVGFSGAMMQAIRNGYQAKRNDIHYDFFNIGSRVKKRGIESNKAYTSLGIELQKGLIQNRPVCTGIRPGAGIASYSIWKQPTSITSVKNQIRKWLSHKQPVVFAVKLPVNFRSTHVSRKNGKTYVNGLKESRGRVYDGGHSMCIYGHDPEDNSVFIKNSWGSSWGFDGTARWRLEDLIGYNFGSSLEQPVNKLKVKFFFAIDRRTWI